MAGMAGHDINYIGLTGVLHAVGQSDPTPPLNLVGDYAAGGLYSVIGILGGLIHRTTTGEGSVVDAAMIDGAAPSTTTRRARSFPGRPSSLRGNSRQAP